MGLYGAQCPAQVKKGMDCNHCQLCAKNHKVVIIFGIHGAHKGKLYKFKKGGSMELIGQASMHGSVMNAVLSM